MSNVRITATGDESLTVEVLLGDANRGWRDLEAGDSVDLAVGGNQTLKIGPARDVPSTFVTPDDEPAIETPFITEGVDVEPEPGAEAHPGAEPDFGTDVVNEFDADSPLEKGSISDLPNPFEDVEEAEDQGDAEAQA